MIAWIVVIALAAIALAALWLSRLCSRLALELALALLLAGLAGYAWQGNPQMPGHPVVRSAGQG